MATALIRSLVVLVLVPVEMAVFPSSTHLAIFYLDPLSLLVFLPFFYDRQPSDPSSHISVANEEKRARLIESKENFPPSFAYLVERLDG